MGTCFGICLVHINFIKWADYMMAEIKTAAIKISSIESSLPIPD